MDPKTSLPCYDELPAYNATKIKPPNYIFLPTPMFQASVDDASPKTSPKVRTLLIIYFEDPVDRFHICNRLHTNRSLAKKKLSE